MPLWSVQEWRARIGTSWCALGRPIRSKSFQYCSTGNYLGSPPPGGGGEGRGGLGRRAESHADHGVVTVVIMISLLIGAILTLSHFILAGDRLIVGCWFVCTPMDLLLVQWILAMSMVSNDISGFFSKSWSLLCCSDSTGSFLSGLEAFPSSANIHGQYCKITISCVYYYMEECKRTDEQHVCGIVLRNFWQNFCGKMRSMKLYLASAMVKASLLLRCGDVEMNPGPLGKLDQVIVLKDLGRIADVMYELEGPIADELGLTLADVAAIKTEHPYRLKLQTRSALAIWKQRNGPNATYANLCAAFERAGYRDFSDNVRRICHEISVSVGIPPKFVDLLKYLHPVADKWEDIGVLLNIDDHILQLIKADHLMSQNCLRELLKFWLKQIDPPPSWSAIAEVLEHLGEHVIASNIMLKYCGERKESHENRQISHLNDSHHAVLLNQLLDYSPKWREIGLHLGFYSVELSNIEASPSLTQGAPRSWLSAMLAEWLQWAPGDGRGSTSFATLEALKTALNRAGLGVTAYELGIPNMRIDPVEAQMTFDSSMSEEDFFKWLRSRSVSEKDRKTLSENGVTALDFVQSDAKDFDDIGLTNFGKRHILRILAEVKSPESESDKDILNDALKENKEDDEISKQLFQEAMCEEGYVSLRTIVLLLIGVAGAGKTYFSHLLFNKDPPSVRESTSLAHASVRAVSLSRATAHQEGDEGAVVWECVSPDQLNYLIADVIKGIRDQLKANKSSASQPQPQSQASQRADTDSAIGGEYQEEQGADNQDASSVASSTLPNHVGHSSTAESDDRQREVEQLFEMKSVQDLISLISKSEGSREISKQDWIYVIDSGGQPQFHDLLPTFVRHVSAAVFFVKLNETLNDCPKIEYYSKGGNLSGHPYRSTQNHLQIIQNCLQAMQSRSHNDDNKYCPDLFFVGTHRDEQHHSKESLEMKNKRLQEILLDHALFRNHFVSQAEGHLLYQVNSKNPIDEDRKVVNNFRKAVMDTHKHVDRVPIRWFILEQLLQQLSVDDVISFRQCLEVAGRLKMKEEHLKVALRYLARLNIFEYFPRILPNVVFTSSQVLLNKVTELVEYSHYLQNSPKLNVRSVDIHFRDYGELTIGMLKRTEFSRHYIPGLFEVDDLLRLWEKLLVIAKHDSNTFVMPAVLSALPQDKLSEYRLPMDTNSADIIPFVVHYQGGLFPSGIFSSLISYLQNKCGWMISLKDKKPECLHRNCVIFSGTCAVEANIALIYFHDWIELHVIDLFDEDVQKSCCLIRNALFSGLSHAQKVQKYDKLRPELAFFCGCKGESNQHLARVTPTKKYTHCSLNTRRREKLTEKCQVWLCFIDAMFDELFSNIEEQTENQDTTVKMEKTSLHVQNREQPTELFTPHLQEEQGSEELASPLPKSPRKSKQAHLMYSVPGTIGHIPLQPKYSFGYPPQTPLFGQSTEPPHYGYGSPTDQQHAYNQKVYATTHPGGTLSQPNVQDLGASLSHNYIQARTHLTIDDLILVYNEVYDARVKWESIGLQLGISPNDLDPIKSSSRGDAESLLEALKIFLNRAEPKPTWELLANALDSRSVNRGAMAEQLRIKYHLS